MRNEELARTDYGGEKATSASRKGDGAEHGLIAEIDHDHWPRTWLG